MAKAKEKTNNTEFTEAQSPVAPATAPTGASISFEDLQAVVQVIDVASSRGAFRGAELAGVGRIYDKLTTFLGNVTAAQQAAKAAQEQKQEEDEPFENDE